jgi:hypothetical protein
VDELLPHQGIEEEGVSADLEQLARLVEYHSPVFPKLDGEDADFLGRELNFRVVRPLQNGWYQVEAGPQVCRAAHRETPRPVRYWLSRWLRFSAGSV